MSDGLFRRDAPALRLLADRREALVKPILPHKLRVCAALGDPAVVYDKDLIGILDGRQTVRDGDGRASLGELFDGGLDFALRFRIHGGGRLIEYQYLRIAQYRAGDRDPLALASRKILVAESDPRRIRIRKLHYEIVRSRDLRRGDHLFDRRFGARVPYVIEYRSHKEERLLRHYRYVLAEHRKRKILYVHAVDQYLPGADVVQADQQVRGAIVLPNGTGKNVRVLAICKGDKADAATAAGADFVGAEDMIQKIQGEGWMDFDVVVTSPDMMGLVGRLGKVLGPRGLMPNPKAGTVTMDIGKAVHDAKAGKIEYRLDKTNIIHCAIGKASFGAEKLQQNFDTLLDAIVKAKPAASKGQYVRSCVVASTMGPGIRINPNKVGA